MQVFFNIHKSINVIHHINQLKDKNHMIISIDAEKVFDKIQHPYIYLNWIYEKGYTGAFLIYKYFSKPISKLSELWITFWETLWFSLRPHSQLGEKIFTSKNRLSLLLNIWNCLKKYSAIIQSKIKIKSS